MNASSAMSRQAKSEKGSGFKPRDVEEPIDYYWHRPLASLLVRLLVPLPITPNQVSFSSAAVSLLAGGAMIVGAYGERLWCAVGGLLLLLSIVLDCADGQLARVRGISSPVGRILDGTLDAVAPLAVFHGMAFYLAGVGYSWIWIFPIGWCAGLSLLWHASVYDVGKNVYLHCSRPDFSLGGKTLLTLEDLEALKRDFEAQGERFYVFLMKVWLRWTKPQLRAMAPWLEHDRCPQNERERDIYLEHFRAPMRVLSWLGFGTHLFLLTVAAWVAPWEPRVIWAVWFLLLVPMNAACVWVVATRAGRERRFMAALAAARQP